MADNCLGVSVKQKQVCASLGDIWPPYLTVGMFGISDTSPSLGGSLGRVSLQLFLDPGVAYQ